MSEEECIEPQGVLKPTKIGNAHLPKALREELGDPHEIPYVADAHTVLLYDPAKTPEEILKSLEVLAMDIRLRIVRDGLVECPECGRRLPPRIAVCWHCGCILDERIRKLKNRR